LRIDRSYLNTVEGNLIGTDSTGTADRGNTSSGIFLESSVGGSWATESNTIGGATVSSANVISGNDGPGICLSGEWTRQNDLKYNYIGTGAPGNGDCGVELIDGAHDNRFSYNTVAENASDGFRAEGAGTDYNLFSRNQTFNNGDLGINLIDGANEGVASPAIEQVTWLSESSAKVSGSKQSGCGIELFSADTDGPGPGEGASYLASFPADGATVWTIQTAAGLSPGDWLTAAQTTALSSTSEFSENVPFTQESPTPSPTPSSTVSP
ncbi:unnamed protein product, partial [marine sediment metagenome]